MKKKILSLILAATMVFAFTACGSKAPEAPKSEAPAAAASSAEAEAPAADAAFEKIVFGTNAEFPPFESVVAKGVIDTFDGIDMAIAANIGDALGCDVEISNMEFDSLLISLSNGQIDAVIAGMTVTPERAEAVDFSTPYYTATQVMIVPEDSDITCAADMADKKIVVVQGYTGETVVSDLDLPYQAFKKGTECVLELVNGKCDVVVIDSATADKYVADNKGLKIVEDAESFGEEEYAIAVKKGNTALLDAINAQIEAMLSNGTIAEISAKYVDEI